MSDPRPADYFPFSLQIAAPVWHATEVASSAGETLAGRMPTIVFFRLLAGYLTRQRAGAPPVRGGMLNMHALMLRVFRHILDLQEASRGAGLLTGPLEVAGLGPASAEFTRLAFGFMHAFPPFPPAAVSLSSRTVARELLLLRLATENRATGPFRELFTPEASIPHMEEATAALLGSLAGLPSGIGKGESVLALLRAPMLASPDSLAGQLDFIRREWGSLLPPEIATELLLAIDIVREEERSFGGGPGKPRVMEFLKGGLLGREGYDYPEYERFSPDADWMPNVVMIAKMVYVWLDQLAKRYGRPIHRLDQVPDEELDRLARWGFSSLWLIGLWERSPASARIKQIAGNADAIASAYSLYDYTIAADLGGEAALDDLRRRCGERGIRLASDMVPNHTGLYSRWTVEHPDWFVQLDQPPYPSYTFNGPDLSFSPEISLRIEDGYWDRRDAAVVFRHDDHRDGRTRYIYHGNDGTSTPWNDTAQLNYLIPEVREAVIGTILHVARQFPIIRFDAAMTLAKKHYQRLWFPQPGLGSGVPSRAGLGLSRDAFDAAMPVEFWREVVDRVAAEAPGTLLLAEAFWLMEGYFVRTLGMHRVYNSAFMNMLKLEENAKYRQTIKNVLEYDHRILQRFVNFMNNPDERTAVEQFGKEGKYFGACLLLVTMPGLPMIGHGQVEGFHEKYGMEYKRAYWDEPVDEHLVAGHEAMIFPLMRRRHLFSGSESFVLYDFVTDGGGDENVFAYTNRCGDERGVILYNNRYGDTSGRVHGSVAMARPGNGEEPELYRTDFGAALGLSAEEGVFHACRDTVTGMQHLYRGSDLCREGLYVRLGAYQFRALLDWRELRDDDGVWEELCRRLGGDGVPDLEEEGALIRYAPLHALFRKAALAEACVSGEPVTEGDVACSAAVGNFLAECAQVASAPLPSPALVLGIGRDLAAMADILPLAADDGPHPLPSSCAGLPLPLLVATFLLLRSAHSVLDGEEKGDSAEAGRFALVRVATDLVRENAGDDAAMLPALSFGRIDLADLAETGLTADGWRALCADPVIGRFLDCHTSEGAEWFRKERFEILLAWAALIAVLTGPRVEDWETRWEQLHDRLTRLCGLAEAAGYQSGALGQFLAAAEGETMPLK